jgi:hypothetical protein
MLRLLQTHSTFNDASRSMLAHRLGDHLAVAPAQAHLGLASPSGHFQNVKQLCSGNRRGKQSSQSFFEIGPFRERRTLHADQTRDLRRFDGRPGLVYGAGAGQKLRCPENRGTIDLVALQRATAHGRWNMGPASVPGTRDPDATIEQIRDAKLRSTNALRSQLLAVGWVERSDTQHIVASSS